VVLDLDVFIIGQAGVQLRDICNKNLVWFCAENPDCSRFISWQAKCVLTLLANSYLGVDNWSRHDFNTCCTNPLASILVGVKEHSGDLSSHGFCTTALDSD
jgi:hypothetical protein